MDHFQILKHYGIRAQKALGQNFLVNDTILETIADSMDITGKNILEIGPGYGALTEKILARKPKSLTLVELDSKMVFILKSRIKEQDLVVPVGVDFNIVEGDVLKYMPEKQDYGIIANIPYYITSPILFRFLHELEQKPEEMVILMQKEVGDKICRKKGYNNSYLSLALEYATSSIEEICLVEREHFVPAPKVDSSVLYFQRKPIYDREDAKKFLKSTSAGFVAPRKKLLSNLANSLGIEKGKLSQIFATMGLLETARAEELDLIQWKALIGLLQA